MSQHPALTLRQREYGHLPDGRVVHEITLSHGGLALSLITLGGIVTTLWAPDRDGVAANVVRGFDNLADYAERNPHFGVIVGRYANRIALGVIIRGDSGAALLLPLRDRLRPILGFLRMLSQDGLH